MLTLDESQKMNNNTVAKLLQIETEKNPKCRTFVLSQLTLDESQKMNNNTVAKRLQFETEYETRFKWA